MEGRDYIIPDSTTGLSSLTMEEGSLVLTVTENEFWLLCIEKHRGQRKGPRWEVDSYSPYTLTERSVVRQEDLRTQEIVIHGAERERKDITPELCVPHFCSTGTCGSCDCTGSTLASVSYTHLTLPTIYSV